jgi:hypothetical protein
MQISWAIRTIMEQFVTHERNAVPWCILDVPLAKTQMLQRPAAPNRKPTASAAKNRQTLGSALETDTPPL